MLLEAFTLPNNQDTAEAVLLLIEQYTNKQGIYYVVRILLLVWRYLSLGCYILPVVVASSSLSKMYLIVFTL